MPAIISPARRGDDSLQACSLLLLRSRLLLRTNPRLTNSLRAAFDICSQISSCLPSCNADQRNRSALAFGFSDSLVSNFSYEKSVQVIAILIRVCLRLRVERS